MQIRDRDHAVLDTIQRLGGTTDTHQLKHELTLNNRQIDYSIKNYLKPAEYVEIEPQEGFTTCTDHRQIRRFPAPNQVTITDAGRHALSEYDTQETRYDDIEKEELVERIHELESRVTTLENGLSSFKKQVKKLIQERNPGSRTA